MRERRVRKRWLATVAAIGLAAVSAWVLGTGSAGADVTVEVRLAGPGEAGGVRSLDLSSFAAAVASAEAGDGFAIEIPGAVGLGSRSMGSTSVVLDRDDEALVMSGSLRVAEADLGALVIVDFDGSAPGPPTISVGVKGRLDLSSLNDSWSSEAGKIVVDGSAVVATAAQNVSNISGAAAFYPGRRILPAGMDVRGSLAVATVLPGFAGPSTSVEVRGVFDGDLAALLTTKDLVPSDPSTAKLTATVAAADLRLPVAAGDFTLTVGVEGTGPEAPMSVTASGRVTIDNTRFARTPVIFDVVASTSGTTTEVSGGIAAGSSWVAPLGLNDVTVESARVRIATTAEATTASFSGALTARNKRFTIDASTDGTDLELGLTLPRIGVGDLTDLLADMGFTVGSANASLRSLALAPTRIEFATDGPELSGAMSTGVTFRGKTAKFLLSGDTGGGRNLLIGVQVPGGTLGDYIEAAPGFGSIPIPEGGLLVSRVATSDAAFSADSIEGTFLAEMFCGATATGPCRYQIPSGVSFAAQIQLPSTVTDVLAQFGPAGTNGTLRVVGSIPVFGGGPLDLEVQLPSILPGASSPAWFREAQIVVTLGVDGGSLAFGLEGRLTVALPDEAEPGGVDVVTFQIDATLEVGADGVSVTIGGGLASGSAWNTPFGVDWLDLQAFRIEITIEVVPTPSIQLGVRAKARIGPSVFDASFAVSVSPGPVVRFGLRVEADVIRLRDLATMAEGLGAGDLDPSSLPDASLRNVGLAFSTIDAPNLCLAVGLRISADIYLGTPAPSAGPGGEKPIDACTGDDLTPAQKNARCLADDACFAHASFELGDDGVKASGALNSIDLGPIEVSDASIALELTTTTQSFSVSGGLRIPGFLAANGTVDISNTGFAFTVTVSDDNPVVADRNLVTISASAAIGADGQAAVFKANLFVRLPAVNEALLEVQRLASEVKEFFSGDPIDYLLSFRCLEVAVDITTSTTDALSGSFRVDIHFGWLHQTDPSLSQGKVFSLNWNFADGVSTNLQNLVGALGSPLGDDNTGCRIPPDDGWFQNVPLTVNEPLVRYNGDLSDSFARTFGQPVFVDALFTVRDPALYEVTFDNGQGRTATDDFRKETLDASSHRVRVPYEDFAYRRGAGGVDDQGVGRYVMTATLRVKGKETVLLQLQLPIVVTDGLTVGHRIEAAGTEFAENERPFVTAWWAHRQGETEVTSSWSLGGEPFGDPILYTRPGADDPRTYPNEAAAAHGVRVPRLRWAEPADRVQELVHRLDYGDGKIDTTTFWLVVTDTSPDIAGVCIEGLCVSPTAADLPVFVATPDSDVTIGIRDAGAETGADNPYIVTMDEREVGGLSLFGGDVGDLWNSSSGFEYTYSLADKADGVYDIGGVYFVDWSVSCWYCPGGDTLSQPMLVVEDNDDWAFDREPIDDGRSTWQSTVIATYSEFEGGCGAVEYVAVGRSEPELLTFAVVDSLRVHDLTPSSMTVGVTDSSFGRPPGLTVVDGVARWVTVPGEKYYVSIADEGSPARAACRLSRTLLTSVFQVEVTRQPAPPVNDAAADALELVVSLPSTSLVDTTRATTGDFEATRVPSCWGDGAQHTVFYRVALQRGPLGDRDIVAEARSIADADGSRPDLQLAVYELGNDGSVGAEIGCSNGDTGPWGSAVAALNRAVADPKVTFLADEDVTYLVVIDSEGDGGRAELRLSDAGTESPVDIIGDGSATSFAFRTFSAEEARALLPCGPGTVVPIGAYAWRAPSTAPVRADVVGGGADSPISVLSISADFVEQTAVACGSPSVEFAPIEGRLYVFLTPVGFNGGRTTVSVTTTGEPYVPPPPSEPEPPIVPAKAGYWMVGASGEIYAFGDAQAVVPTGAKAPVTSPVVKLLEHPDGTGLWVLEANGVIHAFGAATAFGPVDTSGFLPGESVATMAATPGGSGLFVFTNVGRAIVVGTATHHGDLVELGLATALAGPIVDSSALPGGTGYYMLGSDGGVFAFGAAVFSGSIPGVLPPGVTLNSPVNGLVADPDGSGYWMVAGDGGVFAFDADFVGSIPGVLPVGVSLNAPINGMVPYGNGYLMVASDGGVFTFSDLAFLGSLGGQPIPSPVVGIAPLGG